MFHTNLAQATIIKRYEKSEEESRKIPLMQDENSEIDISFDSNVSEASTDRPLKCERFARLSQELRETEIPEVNDEELEDGPVECTTQKYDKPPQVVPDFDEALEREVEDSEEDIEFDDEPDEDAGETPDQEDDPAAVEPYEDDDDPDEEAPTFEDPESVDEDDD